MLAQFLTINLFAFFIIFARLGAALMLLPPFGDVFVLGRARLVLALAISLVALPVIGPMVPPPPASALTLALMLASEVSIGLFIGSLVRIMMSALQTASIVIAYQTGLGTAAAFNPTQNEQGILISRFFTLLGLVMLFATNLHLVLISGLIDSFIALPPGVPPVIDDIASQAVDFVAAAFIAALKVAAPLLILGVLFYLGLGLLSRLMPSIQVLFIALPLQIAFGFWIVMVMLSGMMLWFFDDFATRVGTIFGGA